MHIKTTGVGKRPGSRGEGPPKPYTWACRGSTCEVRKCRRNSRRWGGYSWAAALMARWTTGAQKGVPRRCATRGLFAATTARQCNAPETQNPESLHSSLPDNSYTPHALQFWIPHQTWESCLSLLQILNLWAHSSELELDHLVRKLIF